jgi:hypothetical protein
MKSNKKAVERTAMTKTFYLLPSLSISKHTNMLTSNAKEAFGVKWDRYYSIKAAWLLWSIEI